jgi:hypothetical protein
MYELSRLYKNIIMIGSVENNQEKADDVAILRNVVCIYC